MIKLILNILVTTFSLTGFLYAQQNPVKSGEKVCFLNFERSEHGFSKYLRSTLPQIPEVLYKEEALPTDFLNCVTNDYTEIIILAHTLMNPETGAESLGYYSPLTGDNRAGFISRIQELIKSEKTKLQASIKKMLDSNSSTNCGSMNDRCVKTEILLQQSGLRQMTKIQKYFESLSPDDKLFDSPKPFLNRIFSLSRKVLNDKASNQSVKLKSIRFISCDPINAMNLYPDLKALVDENNIHIELSPAQNIQSWIRGHRVSTLDPRWALESTQFPEADQRASFYIKLKTLGVYRFGETIGLRSKYKVSVKGAALGLSSQWTQIQLKMSDLNSLNVGESKSFFMPHFDLFAAFWLNFDVGLTPIPTFNGPSEINSIGAGVGLFSKVTIERLY